MPKPFVGEFEHTLDDKGRLVLPAAFRAPFEEGGYLVPRPDGCLGLMTPERFGEEADRVRAAAPQVRQGRNSVRLFYARAQEISPDRAGRIGVPAKLRDYADLDQGCVVIGVDDFIEIWDAERYQPASEEGAEGLASPEDFQALLAAAADLDGER